MTFEDVRRERILFSNPSKVYNPSDDSWVNKLLPNVNNPITLRRENKILTLGMSEESAEESLGRAYEIIKWSDSVSDPDGYYDVALMFKHQMLCRIDVREQGWIYGGVLLTRENLEPIHGICIGFSKEKEVLSLIGSHRNTGIVVSYTDGGIVDRISLRSLDYIGHSAIQLYR